MAWPPTVADFKAKFNREFVYGDGLDTVQDGDIQNALNDAPPLFNQSLLDTLAEQAGAFLYLAAHLMVKKIQAAGGLSAVPAGRGVRSTGEGVVVSKGLGQANVAYQAPPDRIAQSPTLSDFWTTEFGRRYVSIISPRLLGNFQVVAGANAEQQDPFDGSNPV